MEFSETLWSENEEVIWENKKNRVGVKANQKFKDQKSEKESGASINNRHKHN